MLARCRLHYFLHMQFFLQLLHQPKREFFRRLPVSKLVFFRHLKLLEWLQICHLVLHLPKPAEVCCLQSRPMVGHRLADQLIAGLPLL